jgi:hypothetical protein
MVGHGAVLAGCVKVKGEGKGILVDLLSDRARVMGCVHLEGAVVCPEVDRVGNAGASPLKDHLCGFRTSNVELGVGVLFPVSEQEWELREEAVVGVAESGQRLRAGIAVQVPLGILGRLDQVFPVLEVIRIGFLEAQELISTVTRIQSEQRYSPLQRYACEPQRSPHRSRRSDRSRSYCVKRASTLKALLRYNPSNARREGGKERRRVVESNRHRGCCKPSRIAGGWRRL